MKNKLSLQKLLLLCGAVAGPLFILTLLIQDYTRAGYDPRQQLLSLLSLGSWGWVQITNFVLAGLLNVLYAFGLWRLLHPGRGGTWGPILVGAYGVGLVLVGIFRTDPANGFPPGVAAAPTTWHGAIHALGALFVFLMLAAALFVFVRLFLARKEKSWAAYCLVSAVLFLTIFFTGFAYAGLTARTLRLAVLIGWMALSLVAIKLLSTQSGDGRELQEKRLEK
ncbi:MAG TPA: DUF998 domain-containing protein [Candidatus Acidoferrum sp.]|nr:DUF998 domain-containing protein [Candidatus Acidoferrum sp.]